VGIGTSTPDTFTLLTVAGAMTLTGQNTGHGASRLKLGQDTTSVSQIRFYGVDNSTPGILQFTGTSADGSAGGERMRIDSSGQLGVGQTSPLARLHVSGSAQGFNGATAQYGGFHVDFYQEGYNSGVGNSNYTLFYYAYDQANWNYQWIKVIVKRGYYWSSGEAAYMINCEYGSVYELYNQQAGTSTSSFTFSNNTINSNRRITTVTFVSPASYITWGFKIETFGIGHQSTKTGTPDNGYISFS
jgi:hypothetical protein